VNTPNFTFDVWSETPVGMGLAACRATTRMNDSAHSILLNRGKDMKRFFKRNIFTQIFSFFLDSDLEKTKMQQKYEK